MISKMGAMKLGMKRWSVGCVFLLGAVVLTGLFLNRIDEKQSADSAVVPNSNNLEAAASDDTDSSVSPQPYFLPNRPTVATESESIPQPDTTQIESILQNRTLPPEESAARLLGCAKQRSLPIEVRLSALDHAFNLDPWQAVTLCMEKPLPAPIAGRLLNGIHNLNESPSEQAAACMHLIEHEDEEIRERAQRLLAFLVSAEEHASDPDKLREKADEFLGQFDEMGEEVSGQ
jgi:hypothetical protein